MDFSLDDRRRLRDLAGELDLPICAVSPNCDLSSPVPVHREAMICCVRECIKLAHDLGSPLCKIFAAWRGITIHDGLATYDDTYGNINWEFCHPARENGEPAGIEYVHRQTQLALEYLRDLRVQARAAVL